MPRSLDGLKVGSATIPASELNVRFTRAGGPGGQNVNKRSTRVEIFFSPGSSAGLSERQRALASRRLAGRLDARGRVRVASSAGRTQAENRVLALARLEGLLADAIRPPPRARRKTAPTRSSVERRLREKKARSDVKRARSRPGPDD